MADHNLKNTLPQLADIQKIEATEFSIDDLDNPRSVISLTSGIPSLHQAILDILNTNHELLEMEHADLAQMVKPSFTLSRLRISFWNEYENANQHNRKMHLTNVIAGVCTETVFKKKMMCVPAKLAYVLCPPHDYVITTKEALNAGLDQLRAIVSAPVIDKNGQLIPKAADVVLKAIALLDMRVKGAVVQRIDQRSLNVNVNKDVTPEHSAPPSSLEELQSQLDNIKQKLVRDVSQARLPSAPEDIVSTMRDLGVGMVNIGGKYNGPDE